jgi:hypothetical protein
MAMKAQQYKMPKHSPEDVEQGYLIEWAARQECVYPELWLIHHIPNGGKRDIGTAVKLKRQGVKPGVPDISLPVPRGIYHGLYIELKVNDNTTSDNQDEWLERLAEQGYSTHVCWGWEEAAKVIENYLKLKRSGEA